MGKKVSHIIISVLLLVATTGFTSFRHYCGDDLISNSHISDQAGCCDDSSTCCHNETQSYQIEDDFFSVFNDYDFGQFPISLFALFGFPENPWLQTADPITFIEGAPLQDAKKAPSFSQVFIL